VTTVKTFIFRCIDTTMYEGRFANFLTLICCSQLPIFSIADLFRQKGETCSYSAKPKQETKMWMGHRLQCRLRGTDTALRQRT